MRWTGSLASELRSRSRQRGPRVHVLNDRHATWMSLFQSPVSSVLPLPSLRDLVSDISDEVVREGGREAGGHCKVPGPVSLRVLLALAGRWVCRPALPARQLASWPEHPVAGTSATWTDCGPASHRHAAGSEEQMGRLSGPAAHRYAASWLCYAGCLGTSGLALVGSRADMLASYGWAAGTGSQEGRARGPLPAAP